MQTSDWRSCAHTSSFGAPDLNNKFKIRRCSNPVLFLQQIDQAARLLGTTRKSLAPCLDCILAGFVQFAQGTVSQTSPKVG